MGCEIRLDEETGEILTRHPAVFAGYWNMPDSTARTIDEDGWLHTGDVGEWVDGTHVRIVDRIKDIIITAGGKNITPANLEAEIKQHALISQCVVIGDRRPFLVALVTLDPEEAEKFAKEQGLTTDVEELADDETVRGLIGDHIEKVNEKFARVEQVKKFEILQHDLSQATGELTPTMKVKRNVVADKYADQVEALYAK
jgi:long-chain acyl-CoA synthetase